MSAVAEHTKNHHIDNNHPCLIESLHETTQSDATKFDSKRFRLLLSKRVVCASAHFNFEGIERTPHHVETQSKNGRKIFTKSLVGRNQFASTKLFPFPFPVQSKQYFRKVRFQDSAQLSSGKQPKEVSNNSLKGKEKVTELPVDNNSARHHIQCGEETGAYWDRFFVGEVEIPSHSNEETKNCSLASHSCKLPKEHTTISTTQLVQCPSLADIPKLGQRLGLWDPTDVVPRSLELQKPVLWPSYGIRHYGDCSNSKENKEDVYLMHLHFLLGGIFPDGSPEYTGMRKWSASKQREKATLPTCNAETRFSRYIRLLLGIIIFTYGFYFICDHSVLQRYIGPERSNRLDRFPNRNAICTSNAKTSWHFASTPRKEAILFMKSKFSDSHLDLANKHKQLSSNAWNVEKAHLWKESIKVDGTAYHLRHLEPIVRNLARENAQFTKAEYMEKRKNISDTLFQHTFTNSSSTPHLVERPIVTQTLQDESNETIYLKILLRIRRIANGISPSKVFNHQHWILLEHQVNELNPDALMLYAYL